MNLKTLPVLIILTIAFVGSTWCVRMAACNELLRPMIYVMTLFFLVMILNFWIYTFQKN